jgi:threonine/homoserine/homoserine lactone efflux protein
MRAGVSLAELAESTIPDSRRRLFADTYMITALNPKSIIFFVAFLPQFVNPHGNVTQQLWLLAGTFVAMAAINATGYTVFAATARRILTSPLARRCLHLTGGSLLSAAGIWALLARRPV